ncbi:uncharacterized protein Dmoj_GI11165 [Drosophila mojavensis]|uniref:Uncharacterized protein n=1 Tax=Drosophila mojavensis TaxID=7230 RepID=B4L897_DROMO|nr:uncharacterized protein Dmoj_GI11165 [Drosophila mojavensis]
MRCTSLWFFVILLIVLAVRSTEARCVCATQKLLRLRSTATASGNGFVDDDELEQEPEPLQQLDLSQLSESQLQQLMQQLNLASDYDDDDRGIGRPWKRVQRIIKRQLVRIPKRYLKKLLRQFGLARDGSFRSGALLDPEVGAVPELYYLIPLE